jgi:hypothetical protein
LANSPLLAGGDPAVTTNPNTDQRGVTRPASGNPDVGAYQTQLTTLAVSTIATLVNTSAQTVTLSGLVTSPTGNAVSEGTVTFTVLDSHGSPILTISPNPATSGIVSKGSASATVHLPANFAVGSYTIQATYSDIASPASPLNFLGSGGSGTLQVLPDITLAPISLPHGTAGTAYSQTLTASGGAGGPYTFAITAGALPTGFNLSSSGVLSGSTTTAQTAFFTVTATDHSGFMGSQAWTLTVDPAAATHFVVSGPSSVSSGTPFSITVTAVDAYGNVATGYRGTVKFSSSDHNAALPGKSSFTASDQGVHTFAGLVLRKKGSHTITVYDVNNGSILGTISISVT